MIYTVGHTANYLAAIERHGTIQKTGRIEPCGALPDGYEGGFAFRTIDEARRLLVMIGHLNDWQVFGLDADWERDTVPAADGWWHNLIRHADIIVLPESA